MSTNLHKQYDDYFIRSLFQKYVNKDIFMKQILDVLEIKKTRFFELLKRYRNNLLRGFLNYYLYSKKKI